MVTSMRPTLREFILLRMAEDNQQTDATANAAWDDAGLMKTAYDHRATLGTLTALVEAHEPGDHGCRDCGQAWPCVTLCTIATAWRDHDEYDPGWDPSAL